MTRSGRVLALLALVMSAALPAQARAAERLYVIAVGYNGLPLNSQGDDETLRPLEFADDDAVNVFQLFSAAGDGGALLTAPDAETRREHPGVRVRPPSLSELRRVVAEVAQWVARDQRAGASPKVVFYYSGHGYDAGGEPALALQDGAITSQLLYDEILAPLSSAELHVLVDACHAEAVVRPRDAQAEVVEVTPHQADAYLRRTTLARYPRVGAIVATTRSGRAHEWDVYGGGVFTHELLSGLRGGADVNGDGLVEYSEIAAFLSAANHDVVDPRARVDSVVRAPDADRHAALIDLGRLTRVGRLRGRLARYGRFYVEDERGVRIVDLHAEPGFVITLVVPAGRVLFVRTRDTEAELTLAPGQTLALDQVRFRASGLVARGAIESELRRGLFAVAFGPGYYQGFVDRDSALSPVAFAPARDAPQPAVRAPARRTAAWLCTGTAAGLGLAALGMGTGALLSYRDVQDTSWEQPASAARERYVTRRNLALGLAGAAALTGVAALLLWRSPSATVAVGVAGSDGVALRMTRAWQ